MCYIPNEVNLTNVAFWYANKQIRKNKSPAGFLLVKLLATGSLTRSIQPLRCDDLIVYDRNQDSHNENISGFSVR